MTDILFYWVRGDEDDEDKDKKPEGYSDITFQTFIDTPW